MKITLTLFLTIIFCSCKQTNDDAKIFILDHRLQDTIQQHIQFVSDRHSSQFKTPIEVRYLLDKLQTDSIIKADFNMTSWYSNKSDTIDLVAHVGEFETSALLLRFIKGKPNVFYYRAPHSGQNYFRHNKTDTFTSQIEVQPVRYKLLLSQIPDTINKPVIYGQIDMESFGYYDKRDTLQREEVIKMKFYFRSQFIKYNY